MQPFRPLDPVSISTQSLPSVPTISPASVVITPNTPSMTPVSINTPVVKTSTVTPTSVVTPVTTTPVVRTATVTPTSVVTPVTTTPVVRTATVTPTSVVTPVTTTPLVRTATVTPTSVVTPVTTTPVVRTATVTPTSVVTPVTTTPVVRTATVTPTSVVTPVTTTPVVRTATVTANPVVRTATVTANPVVRTATVTANPVVRTATVTPTTVVTPVTTTPVVRTITSTPVNIQTRTPVATVSDQPVVQTALEPFEVTPVIRTQRANVVTTPVVVPQPVRVTGRIIRTNVVIDGKKTFSDEILKECYETHNELTKNDIEWAVRESSKVIVEDPEANGRWPDMVLYVLHMCKSLETGKLSFVYNFEIDDAIKRRDEAKLRRLIKINPNDIWQEKTKNDLLTQVEQAQLTEKRDKEMIVVMNVIAQGKNMRAPYMKKFITPCMQTVTKTPNNNTVYTDCYKGVCIEEANQSRRNKIMNNCNFDVCDRIDTTIVNVSSPDMSPDVIMVQIPTNDAFLKSETRCYEFNVILEALTETIVYDPVTKDRIPDDIAEVLKDRYETEIKMYKFYMNYINNIR